ncbi:ROK family protein [Congregibacter variabilis]|uniref:ROK family protein n=1 Tax=Congregibacter variabilis TaxID=3081200 RepID=A0ABZ0I2E3_9GAMM|nr:ROK family protein [Congregibacter sp. IMCC43200]
MGSEPLLLGVDLGGTKIEAALVSSNGEFVHRKRCATPVADYPLLLSKISALCDSLENSAGLGAPLPLGICTPGSPSPANGLMRNCNSTVLNGQLLQQDLENVSGRAVRIANDADCLVLSEAIDGAGHGARSVFGVIIGTGVGGGLFINNALLQGPNAVSGEWGHNAMPLERISDLAPELVRPRPCYCGRQNCIETWLSGPGLALTHEQLHKQSINVAMLSSEAIDGPHSQTISTYIQMLAAALAGVVNVVDPEVIVLGGGLSNIELIYKSTPDLIRSQVLSDVCRTKIYAAQHGDSSGIRGAARLWQHGETPSYIEVPA